MFAEFVGEIFCGAVGGMGGPRCAGTGGEGGLHVCKSVRWRKRSLELEELGLILTKLRHQLIETRLVQGVAYPPQKLTGACQPHQSSLARPALCAPFATPDSSNPDSQTPQKEQRSLCWTQQEQKEWRHPESNRDRDGFENRLHFHNVTCCPGWL